MRYKLEAGREPVDPIAELLESTPVLSYDSNYFDYRIDLTMAPILATDESVRSQRVTGCAMYMQSPDGAILRITEAFNTQASSTDVAVVITGDSEEGKSAQDEETGESVMGYMLSFINEPDTKHQTTLGIVPLGLRDTTYCDVESMDEGEGIKRVLEVLKTCTPLEPDSDEVRELEGRFKAYGTGVDDGKPLPTREQDIQPSRAQRLGAFFVQAMRSVTRGLRPPGKND